MEGSTPISRHDVKTFTREQLDAGWRLACLVNATRDLVVDVPPLTTRPKAATVGVGRQVILRPAIQKRYVELDRADALRPAHGPGAVAGGDRRPGAAGRPARAAPAAGGAAGGRLQGDRGGRRRGPDRHRARRHHRHPVRHRLRPGHHDGGRHPPRRLDRHPGRGGVDAQPPAAVRRRRDHPDQRGDDGPGHPRPAAAGGRGDPVDAGRAGLRRGRGRPRARLRGGARRQRDDDRPRARHRPGAAGRRAVRHVGRAPARRPRGRARAGPAPARPRRPVPGARGVRRRRHRGRDAGHRHGPRQAHAPADRRRHQLRDRAQRRRPDRLHRRARRPGLRGRCHPVRDAGRGRARSRW